MNARAISPPPLTKLRDTAVRAAHEAGRVLMERFRTKLKVREKPKAGIVTDADVASERAALSILRNAYPEFGILSEESAPKQGHCPGRWILDPLDGTTNFAQGFPMFSVSIAAEWNGEIVAGVIFHPVFKETYTAIRGKGAFVNNKRISTSSTRKLQQALLTTGFSSDKAKWLRTELLTFEQLNRVVRAIRRPGSAALDLAYVARGVFDGFWERGLSPWDIAAGALLVHEAGGTISDFKGAPNFMSSSEVLASNGSLHESLLREVHRAAILQTQSNQQKTSSKIGLHRQSKFKEPEKRPRL